VVSKESVYRGTSSGPGSYVSESQMRLSGTAYICFQIYYNREAERRLRKALKFTHSPITLRSCAKLLPRRSRNYRQLQILRQSKERVCHVLEATGCNLILRTSASLQQERRILLGLVLVKEKWASFSHLFPRRILVGLVLVKLAVPSMPLRQRSPSCSHISSGTGMAFV
jgi:hypothetical protein